MIDPATGRLLARVEEAGADGVARAVAAGATAFETWRRTPTRDRAAAIAHNGVVAKDAANRARVEYHVRWLIEAYRARNGYYPADLDELAASVDWADPGVAWADVARL